MDIANAEVVAGHTGLTLVVIGSILLVGLATDYIGRISRLPRVSLLFLFGFLVGPAALNILPDITHRWFPIITTVALVLVGFLLGGKLAEKAISQRKKEVVVLSVVICLVTAVVMIAGLLIAGFPLVIALVFAGIASATDPATTLESVKEAGKRSVFTDILQGIVSLDDAIALLLFSVLLMIAHMVNGSEGGAAVLFLHSVWEVAGAVLLGALLGFPMAYMTGRIRAGEPTLVEALGLVLLCGGLAELLDVSYLIAAVVLGYIVAKRARHHTRAFHEIEDIEWPFIIVFFVLTGASVDLAMIGLATVLTVLYIVLRIVGRLAGSWVGGTWLGSSPSVKMWMGPCLLPQAGIATGLALLAASQFPQYGNTIVSVVVVATIFFELTGPLVTRFALSRVQSTAER